MTRYKIQEWPDMPGDTGGGDALIYSDKWEPKLYDRHKSWHEAWMWLAGTLEPGDTVKVLPPKTGYRDASY